MNVDGNATISHPELKRTGELVFAAGPPIESQEAAVQTPPIKLVSDFESWIPHSEWFKANVGKIRAGPKELQDLYRFHEEMKGLGFGSEDIESVLEKKETGHNKQLVRRCRLFRKQIAIKRFLDCLNNCEKPKTFYTRTEPCNQPMTSFVKEEPCNSPNLQGCLCSPW